MAIEYGGQSGNIKSLMLSLVLIMIAIAACAIIWIITIDVACRSDINRWQPIYPGAETIQIRETGTYRMRATGVTEIIYFTTDDPITVRGWYRDYRRELTSSNPTSGGSETAARGMATTRQSVNERSDGSGTLIYQYSDCATT